MVAQVLAAAVGQPLWHMGALHPVEQAITLLLAFGPFVVLGVVVLVRRRAEAREEESARTAPAAPTSPTPPGESPDGQRER